MNAKRDRSSPGETLSEKRSRVTSMKKFSGLQPYPADEIMETPKKHVVDTIFTDILIKDDKTYLGSDINDTDAMSIWDQVFKVSRSNVFGVAIIKNKERTLGINYRLKKEFEID